MTHVTPASAEQGDRLPDFHFGPISRHMLALYCGGSGDHNPIHVDTDFAREAGYDDVFVHGMLSMAIIGRMLTEWAGQDAIRKFGARFTAITKVHDTLTCHGVVTSVYDNGYENIVELDLSASTQDGRQVIVGTATVSRSSKS